jgi:hypothetical protein
MEPLWQSFPKENNIRFDITTTLLAEGSFPGFHNGLSDVFGIGGLVTPNTGCRAKMAMAFHQLFLGDSRQMIQSVNILPNKNETRLGFASSYQKYRCQHFPPYLRVVSQ